MIGLPLSKIFYIEILLCNITVTVKSIFTVSFCEITF